MSLARAGVFLMAASAKNRVRRLVQRLQQPRYLVGTAVAVLYLYQLVFRRLSGPGPLEGRGHLGAFHGAAESLFLALALITVLWSWVSGSTELPQPFSEAEVQLLFSGPVTRSEILHFKLLRTLVINFFSALLGTFFFRRGMGANFLFVFIGTWLTLGTLFLQNTAVALTRASLQQHGRAGWRRGRVPLVGAAAVVVALVLFTLWVPKPPLPAGASAEAWMTWAESLSRTAPLSWVLLPLRALLDVAFAADVSQFLHALPKALGVMGLTYLWALRSEVGFEEGALEASTRRARALEARRSGRAVVPVRVGRSLALGVPGWPAGAITWKNLVALRRSLGLRSIFLLVPLAAFSTAIVAAGNLDSTRSLVGVIFAAVALGTPLLGPLQLRADFRRDVVHLEVLKAFPVSGAQLMLAELLAPTLLLSVLEWASLLGAFLLLAPTTEPLFHLPALTAPALALSAAFVGPALCAASLAVQNAAAVLFPGWVAAGSSRQRGIEAMGQRLLSLAGTLLVLVVGVFPAAGVGLLGFLVLKLLGLQALALVLGSVLGTALLVAEVAGALVLLGRIYERMDASEP